MKSALIDSKNQSGDENATSSVIDLEFSEPPDGGWGWIIVFGSFMVHVLTDGVTYAFGIFIPEIVDFYNSTRQCVGWLNSVLVGVTFIAGPFASKLCDLYGFRVVTIVGGVLGMIGLGATFFYSSLSFLFITTSFIGGVGFGLSYLPSICVVSKYFEKKRALAVGLAVCGSGFGTFIFGPLIGILLKEYTWRGTMLITGGLVLNCCVCGALYRPLNSFSKQINISNEISSDIKPSHYQENDSRSCLSKKTSIRSSVIEDTYMERANQSERNSLTIHSVKSSYSSFEENSQNFNEHEFNSLRFGGPSQLTAYTIMSASLLSDEESGRNRNNIVVRKKSKNVCSNILSAIVDLLNPYLLRNSIFMIFAVSNFLTSLGFNAPFLFAVDRALLMGVDEYYANFLVSYIGIGNTLGRVIFGALATKGSRKFRLHLYCSSLILCGLITGVSCLAYSYPLMVAYTFGFGLFSGTYVTLTPVILVDLLGVDCLNDSFGLTLLFMGVAVLVGPPLAGAIFDMTGSFDISFGFCGLFILMSGLLMYPVFFLKWTPLVDPKRKNIF